MVIYKFLIRTIYAAKEARENGLENTADAFDELKVSLLALIEEEIQSETTVSMQQRSRRRPRRLSTRRSSRINMYIF